MDFTGEEKIKKLEAEIADARSPKQKCNLLIDMAMELRHSNSEASLQEAQKAVAISEEINFASGKARSYFCMGLAHFNLSDYEKAFVFLDRAYHIFLEAGDKWGISNALNNIGLIHLRLGDYAKALEHFSSSLEIKKESGDRFGTANVMISMAAIHRETGSLADAQMLLTESLKISEELKSDALISKGLMELGIILMMENKFTEATGKFDEAKIFFENQNNSSGIAQCLLHLGKTKSQSGDPGQAVLLFGAGKRIAAETGDKSLLTVFICNIAAEKLRYNEPDEAIRLLHEAKEISSKTQEKPMLAIIAQQLSAGYEAIDNLKDALIEYKNFIALKDEINSAETTTRLQNQQISSKVIALEKENKMLEVEKMAAIGQLTAGIAHEINNPVNFIASNISPVRKNIADILTLLWHYEEMLQENSSEEKKAALKKMKQSLEINYAIDETNQLLKGIENGANRIKEIVNALRVITRLDEESFKAADVHEEIDAALLMLENKIGSGTVIMKQYGNVGPFEHFPALLSQALMNILQNAIEAIGEGGNVVIKTFEENNSVCITITDTGKGMNEKVKRKIFDPFFTTKEVGAGLGLGLSVARSIIEQHQGTIAVESAPGTGTEVKLTFPLRN